MLKFIDDALKNQIYNRPLGIELPLPDGANQSFTFQSAPQKVIFGPGSIDHLSTILTKLDAKHPVVIYSGTLKNHDQTIKNLPIKTPCHYYKVTLEDSVKQLNDLRGLIQQDKIDCLISIGGGKVIELARQAGALKKIFHIAIPTSFSGREMSWQLNPDTSLKQDDLKRHFYLPKVVIYDANLLLSMPKETALMSAMHPLAHALEALYAPGRSPITTIGALEAIRAINSALPELYTDNKNIDALNTTFYATWFAGLAINSTGCGLHHGMARILTGSFKIPSAMAHCVLLPYTISFNNNVAEEILSIAAISLNGLFIGGAIYDLIKSVENPVSLKEVYFQEEKINEFADLVMEKDLPNPKAYSKDDILDIIHASFVGKRPQN